MTVVYGATRRIYANLRPCINSLKENGGVDEIIVLAEDDELPGIPEVDRIINVSGQTYFDRTGPNATKRWTYMVLLKTALSKILPEHDRVLFLDCDTIVEHDLSELWSIDLTGYYFGAVRQINDGRYGAFTTGIYFNTGVLLCNLAALRKDHKDDELIETLNTKNFAFCEQDAITQLCAGRILALPGRYNVNKYTERDNEIYIRHFAADPLWMRNEHARRYNDR